VQILDDRAGEAAVAFERHALGAAVDRGEEPGAKVAPARGIGVVIQAGLAGEDAAVLDLDGGAGQAGSQLDGQPASAGELTGQTQQRQDPDIVESLKDILLTIEQPSYREPDPIPGRERLFRRGGPEAWIRVIVEFSGDFDRVVTAFPQTANPRVGGRR